MTQEQRTISEMPKWIRVFIQVLRTSVRPITTYALLFVMLYCGVQMFANVDLSSDKFEYLNNAMNLLFKLNLVTLSFWFGEKLVSRSGLVDFLIKFAESKKEEKDEESPE